MSRRAWTLWVNFDCGASVCRGDVRARDVPSSSSSCPARDRHPVRPPERTITRRTGTECINTGRLGVAQTPA